MTFLKWIFKENLYSKEKPFNIGGVTVCDTWDPDNEDWDKRGGFNFSTESSILRWVSRGDMLCEITIPEDATLKKVTNSKTPDGIYVSNKIIITKVTPVSDELTLEYYKKSDMPLKTYLETIAALAIRGCYKTCLAIINDKVNKDNIDFALDEYKTFIRPWHKDHLDQETYDKVLNILNSIKE